MINLIPPERKQLVVREYWVRVLSIWALLLSGVCIATALLLIPAYVLVNLQLNALQGELQENNQVEETFLAAEAEVRQANEILNRLSQPLPERDLSGVVNTVSEIAMGGIELRRFELSRKELALESFQIQGTAATREELAAFKTALEDSELFDTVALPISDLAHDTDLPFAVTITLSPKEQ